MDTKNFIYTSNSGRAAISKQAFVELVRSGGSRLELALKLGYTSVEDVDYAWRKITDHDFKRLNIEKFVPEFKIKLAEKVRVLKDIKKAAPSHLKQKANIAAVNEMENCELRERSKEQRRQNTITASPGAITPIDPLHVYGSAIFGKGPSQPSRPSGKPRHHAETIKHVLGLGAKKS